MRITAPTIGAKANATRTARCDTAARVQEQIATFAQAITRDEDYRCRGGISKAGLTVADSWLSRREPRRLSRFLSHEFGRLREASPRLHLRARRPPAVRRKRRRLQPPATRRKMALVGVCLGRAEWGRKTSAGGSDSFGSRGKDAQYLTALR